MANITLIGTQWGDEGKGKFIDWLAERSDIVVRFQGGNNAGHTIVADGRTHRLALLPSGVIRGRLSVIGAGVVVDPWSLLAEIDRARGQGLAIGPETLAIADTATLVLPLHVELDAAREARGGAIGTTRRGIGPAYEDKAGRRGLRFADLAEPDALLDQVGRLLAHHAPLRADLGLPPLCAAAVTDALLQVAPRVLPYVRPALWQMLAGAIADGQRILFEGAQASMLDVDHGTYPCATAASTLAGQAAAGAGVPASALGLVLGIVKAYSTRVGAGPLPTEQFGAMGDRLGRGGAGGAGAEFGTNTGRKRRCGWFDAVPVRQSVVINGVGGIVVTKLDVLDGLDELRICTGYRLDGADIAHMPASLAAAGRVVPVYETLPGWSASTQGARRWSDLPPQAAAYLRRIEALAGAPIMLVGTGADRDDTILLHDPIAAGG